MSQNDRNKDKDAPQADGQSGGEPPRDSRQERTALLDAAVTRLLPRMRVMYVTAGLLILFGSAALASLSLTRTDSLVPVAIFLLIGGLVESGIGHHASGDGPSTPWVRTGLLTFAAGVVTLAAAVLPVLAVYIALGLLYSVIGFIWMRAGFAMPSRYETPVLQMAGGAALLAGMLLLSRWGGGKLEAAGLLMSLEMLVRGWAWAGFAFVLTRRMENPPRK